MSAQPGWTPAARPGIIPLHPVAFGVLLGRSFAALRHNPKVLLGFALGVQSLVFLLLVTGVAGVGWLSFSRLDTLTPGTEEWDAVAAGSVLTTGLAGLVLGLLASALQVIVQGVVVGEVAHAVVAEKLTLRALWRQVRPSIWRLLGYTLLVIGAVVVFVAVVGGLLFALGAVTSPTLAVILTVLTVLAAIPLYLWLSTKLLLVPSTIILERAGIRAAIARSWRLVRGRFWPALGVIVVISVLFGVVAQLVQIPFSLLSAGLLSVFAPTGEPGAEAVIGFVAIVLGTNILTLLIQAIALVVQASASVLVYVDCRMRHEGLDIDLLTYIERRDAGLGDLGDPWRAHIGGAAPLRRTDAPSPPETPAPPSWAPPAAPSPPGSTQWTAPGDWTALGDWTAPGSDDPARRGSP